MLVRAADGRCVSVTAATIASWMKRLDEQGPDALVQIREPVNKFPDFVRYAVQRLKTLCPRWARSRSPRSLCRAGLHLGATTVGRILKESPRPTPRKASAATGRVVTAREPNHVWHVDLDGRAYRPWLLGTRGCHLRCRSAGRSAGGWPWSLTTTRDARWASPFFRGGPTRLQYARSLERQSPGRTRRRSISSATRTASSGARPSNAGADAKQSDCGTARLGKHGSIAVVERFIRTMKDEAICRIPIPQRRTCLRAELDSFFAWYNEHRPHATLQGKTPNEVSFRLRPANRRLRIEPRKRWPCPSPCAKPFTLIAGHPGVRFTLEVDFLDSRRHLPIVSLNRAA